MPDSFELSDNGAKNKYNLRTPLGGYSKLGIRAAQQQAVSDYVKLRAAEDLVVSQDLADYRLDSKKMSVNASGNLEISSYISTNSNIDIGRRVDQDSLGNWIISEGTRKVPPYDGYSSEDDAKEAALQQYVEKRCVDLIKGSSTLPPGINQQQQAALREIDSKVETIKEVIYGDSRDSGGKFGDKASGRYGVIKGYDGVMLNESYSPDRMFLLLNRSKVLVDQKSFDYNTGKTKGAAV